MELNLSDSIKDLYKTFEPYNARNLTGCTCCVDPRDSTFLALADLSSLSARELDNYSRKALTTWGEEKDFKHFIPRLFEIVSANPDAFTSLEVLFGKLRLCRWLSWPDPERKAVDNYLKAFWRNSLRNDPENVDIDTVICAIGGVRDSLKDFLDTWGEMTDPNAYRHLARFILLNADDVLCKNRLVNSFWEEHVDVAEEVMEWLLSSRAFEILSEGKQYLTGEFVDGQALTDSVSALSEMILWNKKNS